MIRLHLLIGAALLALLISLNTGCSGVDWGKILEGANVVLKGAEGAITVSCDQVKYWGTDAQYKDCLKVLAAAKTAAGVVPDSMEGAAPGVVVMRRSGGTWVRAD